MKECVKRKSHISGKLHATTAGSCV